MAYDSSSFKPQVDEVGQIILDARAFLSDPAKWFIPRDEVEEGIQAVIASLGVQAAELQKLADDLVGQPDRIIPMLPLDAFAKADPQ